MGKLYLRRYGVDSQPQKWRIKQFILTFFILFSSLLPCQKAMARYDCQDFDDKNDRFDATAYGPSGKVEIKVLFYWSDCIASSGDSHIDEVTLKYGNYQLCKIVYVNGWDFKIDGLTSKGGLYLGNTKVSNGNTYSHKIDQSGDKWYINFTYYPEDFQSSVSISSGKWHYYYGGNYTNDISYMNRDISWSVKAASDIEFDKYILDLKNKKTTIVWKKGISNDIDKGNKDCYKMSSNKGNNYTCSSLNSGVSTFEFDGIKTEPVTYTATYSYRPNYGHTYQTSKSYSIPAFVYPTNSKAVYNSDNKTVEVSWGIPSTIGSDYIDKGYIIKRRKASESKWVEVGRTGSAKETSFVDKSFVNSNNINDHYVYRIETIYAEENKYNGDNYTSVTIPVSVCTDHMRVSNLEVVSDSQKEKVELKWNVSGNYWAQKSLLKISRRSITSNSKKTEVIAEFSDSSKVVNKNVGGVLYGSYVDSDVALCTPYIYFLQIEAPDVYGKMDTLVSDTVLMSEIGTIQKVTCSKGYYPDRTEVAWSSTGYFNYFMVERKLAAESDSTYRQLTTIQPNAAQSNYMYEDKTCIPGNVYVYRICGTNKCATMEIVSNKVTDVGFRTPTGDFYGRVIFENGQAVDSVEVYLSSENGVSAQSLLLNESGITTTVPQLEGKNAVTFQAWMSYSKNSDCTIQLGDYSIVLSPNGKAIFSANETTTEFKIDSIANNSYFHLTATFNSSAVSLYKDGKLIGTNPISIPANTKTNCTIGNGFIGNIDEVRIWTKELSASEIASNYSRYIVGDEESLACYYTFDFIAEGMCFDMSQTKLNYNGNNGTLSGTVTSGFIPNENQLAHKAITDADGKYAVRSVPYYGNGTAYTLTPRKGTHQFAPSQEIRLISEAVPSHTVNFTDNSSFLVSGDIFYSGGNFPVEGVHFTIDGVPALNKTGEYILSDADGHFSINVPVGIHEVKMVKDGHSFDFDGRICSSDSAHSDLNYQDMISELKLVDNTKVKYIGRICGGTIQEAFPVGFSLSKNNLADDMKVILTPTNVDYALQESKNVHSDTIKHAILTSTLETDSDAVAKTTIVDYNKNDITIHVNNETGEFVAWVFPIEYNVSLSVYGHDEIMGDNSSLDLSRFVPDTYETYKYRDKTNDKDVIDSVAYRQKQVFTKRYRAKMEVYQCSNSGRNIGYFGKSEYDYVSMTGERTIIPLYVDSTQSYTFNLPVFIMNEKYNFHYDVFEEYPYYVDSKLHRDDKKTDRVDVSVSDIAFNNKMAFSSIIDTSKRIYSFVVSEPDMTTAKGTIAATFTYGDSENPTSVSWVNPLGNENGEAYVFGSHQTGTDFVTGGPDKLLCVLRDPPGSNSYAYFEKGTSFVQSSTYSGSFKHEGSEMWNTGYQAQTLTLAATNTPATSTGTINLVVGSESGIKAGIVQETDYTGVNSKTNSMTLTTRIQTSDDPIYVGANADVYIGYSTNVSFGTTNSVTPIPMSLYKKVGGDEHYEQVYAMSDSFVIVKSKGVSALENFETMFAYPQIYIEQTLIPNLKALKKSLLLLPTEVDNSKMQEKADNDGINYYVSKVSADNADFGKPGSYTPYYTSNSVKCDTINYLNQSIERWEKALSDNDSVKVNASKLHQNYSFQAGANIEYSESYSSTLASTQSFSIDLGVALGEDYEATIAGAKTKFEYEEKFTTTQGGEFSDEAEASHAKGFVLAEDGDDDYLSVDVLYEEIPDFDDSYVGSVGAGSADTSKLNEKDTYPSFVFRTRGGATSCPYEGAYKAVHWKNNEDKLISAATMKLEEPSIDMPKKFIENVPSGEDAYLTVYMKNNSETGEDQWFDLRFVDATNPNGAIPSIDGNSMSGFALEYLVPAGQVLEKTLAITKGSVLNYDDMALALCSKCQADPTGFLDVIADTVYFSVHFIPSCTNATIITPSNNWTYNTNCATDTVDGVVRHYMPITISGFDVNYTDFEHIELQYKSASGSDNDWITLGYYYKDDSLAQNAKKNGFNAFSISSEDAGNIYYNFYMDNLPDQNYDLRAVSFCNINNQLYDNPSEIVSGIKDMYNPRLFGSPTPANGVLTIEDDIRINFNETIADGMLTINNFEVTGIRNGSVGDHSVSISLDGDNDYLATEVSRNFANKDLTFECWINYDSLQNAIFFSHGDAEKSLSMGMNEDGKIVVNIGKNKIVSENVPEWEKSSWNHVALVYDNTDQTITAYVNYVAIINAVKVDAYNGNGIVEVGRDVATQTGYFNGKVDMFRIWGDARTRASIQGNSVSRFSGNDLNLLAYYDMDEAKGSATEDRARGANLMMKGCSWSLPEGRSVEFDGKSYIAMNSASAIVTPTMDFTLEFWFNAQQGAAKHTILSNGNGINNVGEDASKLFSVGFDEDGVLTFRHNGKTVAVDGHYADNNWHNFTLAVNRSAGIARIYMDGELNTYFDADQVESISSDMLYAGARVWKENKDSIDRTADEFFTGKVDEIRLWNLYRQQSQIEAFYNQQTSGDEMGLLLYYPFEHFITWQGRQEMQFTLKDKANEKNPDASKKGTVNESTDIPPVKTKGATSSLLYDWVVNNDGLIINVREQDYRIEKTIVNFTVEGVQDVNGNYIKSPITWSAYIDRNQLKWMDDALTINKNENESYSFEMPIVNKGGSVINYTLKNMPSWLSASTESGVINPLEKQTIEFEIDPSLAVGTYDEVVYLTNSNNVTEPLSLNVIVEGAKPEWNVDPKKYEFGMAVFAQIKLDNQFSNDKNDMLAAFYNGECVGVANMSYDKTMDLWYAMLTVYSKDSKSHDLAYRIWDASKGLMFEADSTPASLFVSDTVYGKPTSPIVFTNGTSMYQNIPLSKGWNWVSFNLKGDMSNMDKYLSNAKWGSNSIVKDLSGESANYSLNLGKWSNSGVKLNNTNMFKIYSDVDQVLSVSGSNIDLTTTEIPVLKESWNYISYLPNYSMTLKEALAGYDVADGDVIKSNEGFAMYFGNEWIGSLKSMQPNCGYMLKNTSGSNKTFKYPSAASSLRSANIASVNASAYESNMNIIAYAPEKETGDKLRVYVGDEENDVVEVALSDAYTLQFINVSANAGDKVRFTMERDGITYEATNKMSFVGDAVYGTPDRPYVLNFNMGGMETLTVYPNPVVDVMTLAGTMVGEGDVTLELFDMVGELVYTSQISVSDNELDSDVNLSFLSSGTYVLKVSRDDESKIFKVVKK